MTWVNSDRWLIRTNHPPSGPRPLTRPPAAGCCGRIDHIRQTGPGALVAGALVRAIALGAAIAAALTVPAPPAPPGLAAAASPPTASPPVASPAAGQAAVGDTTWAVPLTPDGDDVNVRVEAGTLRLARLTGGPAALRTTVAHGALISPAHPLTRPGTRLSAETVSEAPGGSQVTVAARGERADGTWTEWVPLRGREPAFVDAPVLRVQARVALVAGTGPSGAVSPQVSSVRLTAQPGGESRETRPKRATTYRIFATREGLVGGTTANGHVVLPRDHFVALPSRRALAPLATGDYTVQACADNGRCEWAPVWDVGPWNITDDHWNPSEVRESWTDLPQGLPQAQAAYQFGYNGGLDGFGRQVLNPAGIDLADGVFWDGLGLTDNAWVTVSYLWTAAGPTATVQAGLLTVRSGPGARYPEVGLAAQHAQLLVECAVPGSPVTGAGAGSRSGDWLRIGPHHYVSGGHVTMSSPVPPC